MVKAIAEHLFSRHLLDNFREQVLEEVQKEERSYFLNYM